MSKYLKYILAICFAGMLGVAFLPIIEVSIYRLSVFDILKMTLNGSQSIEFLKELQKVMYQYMFKYLILFAIAVGNGTEKENFSTLMASSNTVATNSNLRWYWGNAYTQIAKYNTFLENITDCPMEESKKEQWSAEVKCLRAYFFLNLAFPQYQRKLLLVATVLGKCIYANS